MLTTARSGSPICRMASRSRASDTLANTNIATSMCSVTIRSRRNDPRHHRHGNCPTDWHSPWTRRCSTFPTDLCVARRWRRNHHIRVYAVRDGLCKNGRVIDVVEPGWPVGRTASTAGNEWAPSGEDVRVFDTERTRLARIPVPEGASNVCFCGASRRDLSTTASRGLYHVATRASSAVTSIID